MHLGYKSAEKARYSEDYYLKRVLKNVAGY